MFREVIAHDSSGERPAAYKYGRPHSHISLKRTFFNSFIFFINNKKRKYHNGSSILRRR